MGEALLIIDVQNDFVSGSLAVPGGAEVIPVINRVRHGKRWDAIVLTKDWHPTNHCSFASAYGENAKPFTTLLSGQDLWPDHCVVGTEGADFHPDLETHASDILLQKGTSLDVDSYSCFCDAKGVESSLAKQLKDMNIKHVVVVGLALDYCVFASARDAASRGFDTVVVRDATRAVAKESGEEKQRELEKMGVRMIDSASVLQSS